MILWIVKYFISVVFVIKHSAPPLPPPISLNIWWILLIASQLDISARWQSKMGKERHWHVLCETKTNAQCCRAFLQWSHWCASSVVCSITHWIMDVINIIEQIHLFNIITILFLSLEQVCTVVCICKGTFFPIPLEIDVSHLKSLKSKRWTNFN